MASKAIDKNKTKNKTLRNRMMYFKQEKKLRRKPNIHRRKGENGKYIRISK